MKLSGEFKSYEMDFNDFSFQFMGWEAGWIPTLSGRMIRNVGMLVMDKNTTPFEVHIETIEGVWINYVLEEIISLLIFGLKCFGSAYWACFGFGPF